MYHVAVTLEVGRRRRSSRRRRVGNVDVQLCEAWREFPRTLDVYEDNMRTLNEFLFGTLHVGYTFTVTTVLDCSERGTRRQMNSSPQGSQTSSKITEPKTRQLQTTWSHFPGVFGVEETFLGSKHTKIEF